MTTWMNRIDFCTSLYSKPKIMAESKKQLIVYAEDDDDDMELMKESFENYSHNVDLKCFSNGVDVLNYLMNDAQPSPCLIVLDINLPGMSGKQVLKKLR